MAQLPDDYLLVGHPDPIANESVLASQRLPGASACLLYCSEYLAPSFAEFRSGDALCRCVKGYQRVAYPFAGSSKNSSEGSFLIPVRRTKCETLY